jgi:hypothetical protein
MGAVSVRKYPESDFTARQDFRLKNPLSLAMPPCTAHTTDNMGSNFVAYGMPSLVVVTVIPSSRSVLSTECHGRFRGGDASTLAPHHRLAGISTWSFVGLGYVYLAGAFSFEAVRNESRRVHLYIACRWAPA